MTAMADGLAGFLGPEQVTYIGGIPQLKELRNSMPYDGNQKKSSGRWLFEGSASSR